MRYRTLGPTGPEVSALGFGCMRLPVIDGEQNRIDYPAATAMIRGAIDAGVNYVDTAFPYHGTGFAQPGESEVFLGTALADGYRERILLATKMPSWLIESRADMERHLDDQLERLQTDHVDCYLLHALKAEWWDKLEAAGVLGFLDDAIADGRIRHAGFSFHDELPVFKRIVDAYPWTFTQIQYNLLDIDYQAGREGLAYAAERGLGVIVMEPLKGGRLAGRVPDDVQAVWDRAESRRTPAQWALRWVWDQPEVSLLLSGMSTPEQLADNLATADAAAAGSLNDAERALVAEVRDVYRSRIKADCTACKYCMPCPSGVDIPGVFARLNNALLYDDFEGAKEAYLTKVTEKASACTRCEVCIPACPQGIDIPEVLSEARVLFGE